MCLLTEQQVAIISGDVENEGINFSHLDADLVDHICCGIESHMHRGISFNEAYHSVKMEFGIKGLRQIQQDTLMLIDKNYRIMKKSMKMIGVLAMALMAFGALFKIGHWPGASIMLTLSFFFTTLVFFPTLLYVIYKEVNQKKQVAIFIIAFISGALFMSGVLFKIMHWPEGNLLFFLGTALIAYLLIPVIIALNINNLKYNKSVFLLGSISLIVFLSGMAFKMQHWPGANITLSLGGFALVFVFIPLFYFHEVRRTVNLRVDFLFGIIAITYFVVLSFLLNLSLSNGVLLDFNFQEKSFKSTSTYINTLNEKIQANNHIQLAIKIAEQADIVYNQLDEVKIVVIQTASVINRIEAENQLKSEAQFSNMNAMVNQILSKNNPYSPLPKLKSDIEQFKEIYNQVMMDSLHRDSNINYLFNTNNEFINSKGEKTTWEDYYFKELPQTATLDALSLWQYNIRLAENRVLQALVTNSKTN
jgi:hypothetical protein